MKNDKMGPVQGFAFGGIANPTQRATLRPSDRAYLEARQREAEAYERQRLAYNKALEDYQSREQTEEFGMAAPVLPFKEADVAARQQQAAQRARRDAGNRAAAIDVVSDPERFGFGSMSIADRFMAKGGEVRGYAEGGEANEDEDEEGVGEVGSAKALLAQLEGQGPRSKKKAAPALKRMAMSGGAAMPKPMDMSPESLASTRELVEMAKDKGTAKEQMAELARLYQLRAATFSQPTLAGETFNKNTLATKRFAEGGEAKGYQKGGEARKRLDAETLAILMREGTNPSRLVPATVDRMPPTAAGLPSLMMFDDPALDSETAGYMIRGVRARDPRALSQALFMRPSSTQDGPKERQDTVAHETEHLLARQNLGDSAEINLKFDELIKDKGVRRAFVENAVNAAPYLKEKYNMNSAYFLPKMVEFQGPRAKNLLYEQLAVLSAIEQVNNVDLTKDPVLRETLFKDPAVRETYNAITGLRQTRLDPRDLPPYERLPEPGMVDKFKKALNFSKGGEVSGVPSNNFVTGKAQENRAPEVTGINRVLDFIAQRLPAESFPTSARTLLETVQGKKEPITESSFSPKELDMMRQIITLKGGDKGSVQYSDYAKAAKQMARQGNLPTSVTPGLLSMADPLGNVQTTLGRFRYARDPEGNMVVMDTYDFNPPVDGPTQEARTGDYGAFGPYGLIRDYAGQKIPTGSGREIRINLGKPVKRAKGSPEEGEVMDPEAALFAGRGDVPAPARNKVLDEILGAGETALTLGTGAVSGMVGMPYGLYKGITGGNYGTRKGLQQSEREAQAFIERNTYIPRTESGRENLSSIAKIMDKSKLPPVIPEAMMLSSIPRTAALAQAERLGMAAEKKLEGPVTRTLERGGKAADLLGSFGTQPSRVVSPTPALTTPPTTQPLRVAPPTGSVKTPAPASELGFYSAAEQAALNLPRKEGTGAAFLSDLMKAPDVKKEELSAMGLDEFLKSKPKATRQEVQDFIANNRFDVKEVQLGGKMDFANLSDDQLQKEYVRVRGYKPEDGYGDLMSREEIIDELSGVPAADLTKFSQYQLPGGDNYREILLTIPGKKPQPVTSADDPRVRIEGSEAQGWRVFVDGKPVQSYKPGVKESSVRDYALADANEAIERRATRDQYKSPHFSEPNILAHLRVNDRVDADGKKMLLIEELQSDWHQAGRDKGYAGENQKALLQNQTRLGEIDKILATARYTPEEGAKLFEEQKKLAKEYGELEAKRTRGGEAPDAPFKDTWHQLALKRALKYAADNGYDRVGLTTGKQQTARFDLSKQLSEVVFDPASGYLSGRDPQGNLVVAQKGVTKESLPDYIGKEGAQKILEAPVDESGNLALRGLDLQVGGEGMKKYYDEIYPGFLAKQAKKYGSQVGETSIKTQKSDPTIGYVDYFVGPGRFNTIAVLGLRADGSTAIINQTPNSLQAAQQLANRYKEKHLGGEKEAVRYIDITPEMKGAVPYAKGGPVDKNTAFIKAHS